MIAHRFLSALLLLASAGLGAVAVPSTPQTEQHRQQQQSSGLDKRVKSSPCPEGARCIYMYRAKGDDSLKNYIKTRDYNHLLTTRKGDFHNYNTQQQVVYFTLHPQYAAKVGGKILRIAVPRTLTSDGSYTFAFEEVPTVDWAKFVWYNRNVQSMAAEGYLSQVSKMQIVIGPTSRISYQAVQKYNTFDEFAYYSPNQNALAAMRAEQDPYSGEYYQQICFKGHNVLSMLAGYEVELVKV